jgi:hypothetical protein
MTTLSALLAISMKKQQTTLMFTCRWAVGMKSSVFSSSGILAMAVSVTVSDLTVSCQELDGKVSHVAHSVFNAYSSLQQYFTVQFPLKQVIWLPDSECRILLRLTSE